MKKTYSIPENSNGGRVALLFLLFGLALYQFINVGLPAFAIVCLIPVFVLVVIFAFQHGMMAFWALIVINYLIQWKDFPQTGIPMSVPNEMLELILLGMALINVKEYYSFDRVFNVMFLALLVWGGYCALEMLNDTCDLGMQVGAWYSGARMVSFQLIYAFLVFTIYINTPKLLIKYLYVWGGLALFAVFWVWKQQTFGMTAAENAFLQGRGRSTHIINGGTTIRLFSIYGDAANYGIGIAATAVAFLIFAITAKVKKLKIFFFIVGLACTWGMFPSGTRTATFCLLAGIGFYTILSKSFRIAVPVALAGILIYVLLAFTMIGNSNASIRRMRSGFNKDDASGNARKNNQLVMKKYLADAPFGIGIGMDYENVPANNKFRKLATIPPDSEYVYIWVHTGVVGISTFLICIAVMLGGASCIVLFRLKSSSLRGIGAGCCCAFFSMQLGGYANQVLMQFPNCLVFFGGLTLVYTLPWYEKEWEEYEQKLLAEQAEKERIKEEKRRAKRV